MNQSASLTNPTNAQLLTDEAATQALERPARKPRSNPRSPQTTAPVETPTEQPSAFERHARKCAICQHEDRAEIEQSFMHWVPLSTIAHSFDLRTTDSIRRHAIAIGLDDLRTRSVRCALRRAIERIGEATPTMTGIIQAIRALSCLDDQGRWLEPTRRVIITHEMRTVDPTPLAISAVAAIPEAQAAQISNRVQSD